MPDHPPGPAVRWWRAFQRIIDRGPRAAWVGVGCGLIVLTLAGWLGQRNWDAAACLRVGAFSPAKLRIERDLGPVPTTPDLGHDGKYSYLIALHPWAVGVDAELRDALGDPGYRYGRPLLSWAGGLGGTLPPRATLWGLILAEVLAGGLLVAATVALARQAGLPTLAVVIGLVNPGVYSSAVSLTSDLPALALSLAGLACWQSGRCRTAVVLFALAVLAKEYFALTPLALAAANLRRPTTAASLAVLPLLPLAAWRLWVVRAVGVGEGGENFGWPGRGVWDTAGLWSEPAVGWVAVALVAATLTGGLLPRRPAVVRLACLGWGLLGLVASHRVWLDPADLLRVICPAWWFATWAWWPWVPQRREAACPDRS